MATKSIREYVKGIIEKEGLVEEKWTKVIFGGPTCDLGGNEILMGREQIISSTYIKFIKL